MRGVNIEAVLFQADAISARALQRRAGACCTAVAAVLDVLAEVALGRDLGRGWKFGSDRGVCRHRSRSRGGVTEVPRWRKLLHTPFPTRRRALERSILRPDN